MLRWSARAVGWALSGLGIALLAACPEHGMDEARALEEKGALERAGARYLDIAKADPANLGAWDGAVRIWCEALVRVGKCMEVLDLELQILGDLQRHRDVLSETLERRARARIQEGLAQAALDDLDRAEEAAPERASVLVARAKALVMLGKRRAALEALYRARKMDPDNEEANEMFRAVPAQEEERFGGPR